ncbi:hypothetical protein PIB30_075675 [Stylosanthes scabra]|uniref:cAMP-regulated phosphoprotein 19-related protein n=1 Tax=Stylosanthes scabra TaxID=79078 RepID=A0ABU6YN66_9FABA|nr:hypothetical protein [Stylosanthes scabra]
MCLTLGKEKKNKEEIRQNVGSLVFCPTVGADVLDWSPKKRFSSNASARMGFKEGGCRRPKLGTAGDGPARPLRRLSQWSIQERVLVYTLKGLMSNVEDNKEQQMDVDASNQSSNMPSSQKQEETIKKKYGGMMPKKPPLISKDHERAYFDSADWALGKQGGDKPKGPLEALRPKLQPTQQQTRYRKSPYAPAGEEGGSVPPEDAPSNE